MFDGHIYLIDPEAGTATARVRLRDDHAARGYTGDGRHGPQLAAEPAQARPRQINS